MKIIAGLGNPGPRYETTRHNVGFLAVDRLVDSWRARGPNRQYDGDIFQADVAGEKVILVKPQTFMNNSGKCIGALFHFYKCEPGDLVVIHDDLDLKINSLRIKTGGGTGGHNGLKSVDAHLGAGKLNYHRIRVGVGRPAVPGQISPADYVLQQYSDAELNELDPVLDDVERAAKMLLEGDISGAQNQFNKDRNSSGVAKG